MAETDSFTSTILRTQDRKTKGGSGSVKAEVALLGTQVVVTVFWEAPGVLLVGFLEDQRMITSASHESVLRMLAEVLVEKHLGKFRLRAPSHSDGGPSSPVVKGSFASAGIHLAVLIWLSCSLFFGDGGGALPGL